VSACRFCGCPASGHTGSCDRHRKAKLEEELGGSVDEHSLLAEWLGEQSMMQAAKENLRLRTRAALGEDPDAPSDREASVVEASPNAQEDGEEDDPNLE